MHQYGGTTSIRNATIAGNTADIDGGGPGVANGGGVFVTAGTVNVRNSIIADNTDGSPAPDDHDDCSGTVNGDGYNLIESLSGCTLAGVTTGNLSADPVLDVLDSSGGSTSTHALLAGSPAINSGNPAVPGSGGPACEAADQRGQPRGGAALRCDIGAFEAQGLPGPPGGGGGGGATTPTPEARRRSARRARS